MPPGAASEQSSWEESVYVIADTRILVIVGLTYLVRSGYQLWQRIREGRRATNTISHTCKSWSSLRSVWVGRAGTDIVL